MRGLLAVGVGLNGMSLITVAGRKTGQPRSTPITIVKVGGQRYVQSPFGNVNWVQNLRAAGKATLSCGRRRETVIATELSAEQAAPIIKTMLAAAGTLKVIRTQFDVTPESSLEQFIKEAPKHPMFAIHAA